jgi:hypothetical protein
VPPKASRQAAAAWTVNECSVVLMVFLRVGTLRIIFDLQLVCYGVDTAREKSVQQSFHQGARSQCNLHAIPRKAALVLK